VRNCLPAGGDGIIYDVETEEAVPTEHVVLVGPHPGAEYRPPDNLDQLILDAVSRKQAKGGSAYAAARRSSSSATRLAPGIPMT
jgi:hypothetical protein